MGIRNLFKRDNTKMEVVRLRAQLEDLQRQFEAATKSKAFFTGFRIDAGIEPLGRELASDDLRKVYRLNSPIRRAVDIVANQVAMLPFKISPAPETEEEIQRFKFLFEKPNSAEETFRDVLQKSVVDALVLNKGTIEIARAPGGKNVQLYAKDASTFKPIKTAQGHILKFIQDPIQAGATTLIEGTAPVDFDLNQLIFFVPCSVTYLNVGPPIMEALANEVAFIINSSGAFAHFSGKDTLPKGFLALGQISTEAYERAQASFTSSDKKGLRVIDNVDKAEWEEIDKSFSEDTNALWDILTRAIFRAFGLIPVNENPNGQSPDYISSQLRQSELVRPIAKLIASQINAKLRDFLGDATFEFSLFPEHGPKELTTLIRGAVITPNEAREAIGFGPIEGGDQLIITSATGTTTAKDLGGKAEKEEEDKNSKEEIDADEEEDDDT